MEISKRYLLKSFVHENGMVETNHMRRINGKRFLFQRLESDKVVRIKVGFYSTRHFLVWSKETGELL